MARQNRAPPIRWAPMTLHGCGKNWGLATSGSNGHHAVLEMFSLSVVWRTFHAMPSVKEFILARTRILLLSTPRGCWKQTDTLFQNLFLNRYVHRRQRCKYCPGNLPVSGRARLDGTPLAPPQSAGPERKRT